MEPQSPSSAATQGHVFISYARDGGAGQEWAERFELRFSEWRIPFFRDTSSLEPGEDWATGIPEGLSAAKALMLVVSRATESRPWINRELAYADEHGIRVIPAIVERGAKKPFAVQTNLTLDFVSEDDQSWASLHATLSRIFSKTSSEVCNRARELAYLEALIQGQAEMRSAAQFYTPLAGHEEKIPRQVIDEACMPQSFRHETLREQENRPPKPLETRHYDDVRDALKAARESTNPGRLVLLGEPGSGKTYTLGRFALELAQQCQRDASALVPVFVPLGQWIHPDKHAVAGLKAYIGQQLGELSDCYESLRTDKRLALLLDGLNEIPGEQRKTKSAAIWKLTRDADFQLVVASCRVKDFEARDTRLELDTLTIEPLTPPNVSTFVHRFLSAQGGAAGKAQAEELFWFLAGGETIKRLHRNWLALELSDAAFWSSTDLPNIRLTGLNRWLPWRRRRWRQNLQELRWEDYARGAQIENPRSLLKLAERPFFLLMMVLLYIRRGTAAFEGNRIQLFDRFVTDAIERVDESHRNKNEGKHHPGRNGLEEALGQLAWAMQNQAGGANNVKLAVTVADAEAFLSNAQQDLAQGAGLLEWRANVRFTHQLIQEYFAAMGMPSEIRAGRLDANELWPKERWWERTGWEEAAIFLAGLAPEDPSMIIDWLKDAQPEVLVQCLTESGCAPPNDEQLTDLKARWLDRLDPEREPAPEGRHAIGLALAWLGLDDRPGVDLRSDDGLPDIDWVEIPAGEFLYGESKEKRHLDTFWMARYPITNAQYQAFIDDGGYAEDRWWKGLAKRIENRDPDWSELNRPRDSITWYESVAFCRWVTQRYRNIGLLGKVQEISLPTEFQWEKAARGTDGREYPWGDGYQSGYANVNEKEAKTGPSNLDQTCAVGLYPQGASPYGVEDLAGNIWEWCLHKYNQPDDTELGGTDARVVRGGSWFLNPGFARAVFRFGFDPVDGDYDRGFRVVRVSPMDTEH